MVATIVLAGCDSGYGEPVMYETSIVNDSDSVFVMTAMGVFVVPPHSLLRSPLGAAAGSYPVTLYATDCARLGQVELSQEKPQAYIDAGGHLSLRTAAEASAAPKPEFETDTGAGNLPGICSESPGWRVDVRNDSAKDLLISLGYQPPLWRRFRAQLRATLAGDPSQTVPPGVSIAVYDAACGPIGSVELRADLEVLFIDAASSPPRSGRSSGKA